MLFAYIGPETFLPVASVLAAITGTMLMFGRHSLRIATRCLRTVLLLDARDRSRRQG